MSQEPEVEMIVAKPGLSPAKKRRNLALLCGLLAFAAIIYLVTLIKIKITGNA